MCFRIFVMCSFCIFTVCIIMCFYYISILYFICVLFLFIYFLFSLFIFYWVQTQGPLVQHLCKPMFAGPRPDNIFNSLGPSMLSSPAEWNLSFGAQAGLYFYSLHACMTRRQTVAKADHDSGPAHQPFLACVPAPLHVRVTVQPCRNRAPFQPGNNHLMSPHPCNSHPISPKFNL